MLVSLIAGISLNRVLGKEGSLPWKTVKPDMARFREVTLNHPVIMGRTTYQSLPEKFRPLPGRLNIILTKDSNFKAPGCIIAGSIEDAVEAAHKQDPREIFFIGGSQIYAQVLADHWIDKVYLTILDTTIQDGDCYFPKLNPKFWKAAKVGTFAKSGESNLSGTFWEYTYLDPTHDDRLVEAKTARNPKYKAHLRRIQANGICPFCQNGETYQTQPVIYENANWWISRNAHPLNGTSEHLIIVPKRHLRYSRQLSTLEWNDFHTLLDWIKNNLSMKGTVFYWREGEMLVTGATVAHLHIQAIAPTELVQVNFGLYKG